MKKRMKQMLSGFLALTMTVGGASDQRAGRGVDSG